MRVCDLGEQGVLKRLYRYCPPDLVGDDAAVLSVSPDCELVVTTDVLVDGVHFSIGLASPEIRTTSPEDVGWRATAANLSDLAAMGAMPLAIVVGLSLPGNTPIAQVEAMYEGMVDCLRPFNAAIAGGDVCRSPVMSVAITAFGQVQPQRVIRRSTARPGDAIVVTGVHGASRAGLELLLHPEAGTALPAADKAALIQAHQRPRPRLDVLSVLYEVGAFESGVAGMDSSDGLADAVLQLCRASGVGARLERRQIPQPSIFSSWLPEEQALNWMLYGGEDFELVLCLEPSVAQQVVQQVEGSAVIGTVCDRPDVVVSDRTGRFADDVLSMAQGFQHF